MRGGVGTWLGPRGWRNQDLAGDAVVPLRESGGSVMISTLAAKHLIRSWAGA